MTTDREGSSVNTASRAEFWNADAGPEVKGRFLLPGICLIVVVIVTLSCETVTPVRPTPAWLTPPGLTLTAVSIFVSPHVTPFVTSSPTPLPSSSPQSLSTGTHLVLPTASWFLPASPSPVWMTATYDVRTPGRTATPTFEAAATVTPAPTPRLPAMGLAEITLPFTVQVGSSDVIVVMISSETEVTEVGLRDTGQAGVITVEVASRNGERRRIAKKIPLYPVMYAEIDAPAFAVLSRDDNAPIPRIISPAVAAAWTWTILAEKDGDQAVTVRVTRPIVIEGATYHDMVWSATETIAVLPIPPRALKDQLLDVLVSQWPALLGTGGPLGLLALFFKLKADRAEKDLKGQLTRIGERIDKLEK